MYYIFSTAHIVSGGPELAQQLCYQLRQYGQQAEMVYFRSQFLQKPENNVAERYKMYDNPYTCKPTDNEEDVIVVPETACYHLRRFKKARRVIWWMSVDFHYIAQKSGLYRLSTLWGIKDYNFKRNKTFHLYQSEYAKEHLLKLGVSSSEMQCLTDYISDSFFEKASNCKMRKNNILFNPKKGYEMTQKLMKAAPSYNWVRLEGMSPAQLRTLMEESKLYIDFGEHPGKDRMPREAAICGCCIITGKRGSARNDVDVSIPRKYKFDEETTSVRDIIQQIDNVLNHYENINSDFDEYRTKISKEKEMFIREVAKLIDVFQTQK